MKPERWQQIERLCQAALEVEEEQRAAFLEEACGGDETLRREVEHLLAQETKAEDFLEVPALEVEAKAMAQDQAYPLVGQQIGSYKILSLLGTGGMGEVYLAQDASLDRKVALKFLPDFMQQDPLAEKRFLREAKSAAALDHPFICKIYEVGEADGKNFISMEYVQGKTLTDKLTEGPLALKDALEKAREIAEALEAAHKHNIVHRDLKPSNLMLTPEGHVKVMDFGLAKRLVPAAGVGRQSETLTASLTETGTTLGTPAYMSPEQLRGEAVDTRSDVFSFGVVLYEAITGVHPFRQTQQMETASAILRDDPSPLSEYVGELPEGLEQTVEKMLAKEPEQRYESAREVRVDLELLRSGTIPFIPARRPRTRRGWLALTGLVVVGTLATFVGLDVGGWRDWLTRLVGFGGPPRIQSLGVLSLENVSGDPEQDYLADGITEALITALGQIGALRVISRTSSMRYKGTDKPLVEIARELNVDAVVEGSAQRVGQEAGITVRLIHAATEQQLWSQGYQRDLSDLLRLQSQVAQAIAGQVEIAVTPEEEARLAATREVTRESYEAYLRGTYYLNKYTPEGIKQGLAHLQQAIEIDPANPLAYAGLAAAYSDIAHRPSPAKEAFPRARAAALRALSLDDTLALAHLAMGEVKLYYEWDLAGAEPYFQRALELEPNLARAQIHYGWYLDAVGREDETEIRLKLSVELDPFFPIYTAWLGWWYWWVAGRYDEAIEEAQKSLAIDPVLPQGLRVLGGAYAEKGMYEEAMAAHQKLAEIYPRSRGVLGRTYVLAGRRDEAKRIVVAELEKTSPGRWALAEAYAALGDTDQAFRWLEKVYESRHAFFPWVRKIPAFRSLHDDPRFDDLMRRAELEP